MVQKHAGTTGWTPARRAAMLLAAAGSVLAHGAALAQTAAPAPASVSSSAATPLAVDCAAQPPVTMSAMGGRLAGGFLPSALPPTMSKAEAILGGQVSKLEQMRLQQLAAQQPTTISQVVIAPAAAPAALPSGRTHAALPAALPTARPVNADQAMLVQKLAAGVRWGHVMMAGGPSVPVPPLMAATGMTGTTPATANVAATPAATPSSPCAFAAMPSRDIIGRSAALSGQAQGRNDDLVLGTLRLTVRQTPLDRQWQRVSGQSSAAIRRNLSQSGAGRTKDRLALVHAVNLWVNKQVRYVEDISQYRQNDYWATAEETLKRQRGDCEDYAIAKMQLLKAAGVSTADMSLIVAHDLVRRIDHAVLMVEVDGRKLLLDNSANDLLDASQAHDYRPILSFAAHGKWIHGYRVAAQTPARPVTLASAQ